MFTRHITVQDTTVYLANRFFTPAQELSYVFSLREPQPVIRVVEDQVLQREYRLETLVSNPDLTGQYLHASIRVTAGGAVIMDGILSPNRTTCPTGQAVHYEAIRLQPFYLRAFDQENSQLHGAGLVERGLHYPGHVTPLSVRCVCICDHCQQSFSLQHLHAGFSEGQYFYAEDGQQTLFASRSQLPLLSQLSLRDVSRADRQAEEQLLPLPTVGKGKYAYYNPFRCPHCEAIFIDFQNNPARRAAEYYGNYLLNHSLQRME